MSTAAARAQPSPNPLATPGRPGSNRTPAHPEDNDRYRSRIVQLGGNARDGLLYEPKVLAANSRVAVLYSDRNFGFDAPAAELARRGYRVLYVSYPPLQPGEIGLPLDGFLEASRGIAFLRSLAGVERVVIEGWGAGATSMTLYADVAAHGPAACQGKAVIYPCATERATGLAKPDGVILLDPGLGSATRASNIDPAYDGSVRSRADLDMFAAANGYDAKTGTANYSPEFRKRYFAAQTVGNNQIIDQALARLRTLDQDRGSPGDEPLFVAGAINAGEMTSLHRVDLRLMSHTKRPHVLLKADGSKPTVVLQSIRPATGPVGESAIQTAVSKTERPARAGYTLREYLANDAIRTTRDFALTDDGVVGVVWKSANTGTPAQAEGVSVPTLVMTDTCFQFVVSSEIVYDHLAAKDKTLAGTEGSEHEFTPCAPQYGDTKKRLFDFVADWLGQPGRF
jgi:hypothetical protein